jgi:ionotropic glutamate receptor
MERKWIGDQPSCQNDGAIIGSSRLNFKNFSGLFLLTGVASTSALLIALVMFLYKKHKIRNSTGPDQIEMGYGEEHINEQTRERTTESTPPQNMQLTVLDDSDSYTCQQEIEISREQSPSSEVQTTPDFTPHGTSTMGL